MIYKDPTDLLIAAAESAKMQRDAGIEEPVYKYINHVQRISKLCFDNIDVNRELPIGVVEGRPVFIGDELWYDGKLMHINGVTVSLANIPKWSWNPPKPKTVVVELLREDVEWLSLAWTHNSCRDCAKRVSVACKAALEKSNESH